MSEFISVDLSEDKFADLAENFEAEKHYQFVVLGGGVTAGYLADSFVKLTSSEKNPLGIDLDIVNKDSSRLAIISAEEYPPYERPGLNKNYSYPLNGKAKRVPLEHMLTPLANGEPPHGKDWYADNNIDLLLGHQAVEFSADKKSLLVVRQSDRKVIKVTYDRLVVATGMRPLFTDLFDPKAILGNVFVMRNVIDADRIRSCLELETTKKAVVVGGGYIAAEMASLCSSFGAETSIVIREDVLLGRLIPNQIVDAFHEEFEKRGVNLLTNRKVASIAAAGKTKNGVKPNVKSVVLDNGDIVEADIVIIGFGVVANTELFLEQLDFEEDSGNDSSFVVIAADQNLFTSDPQVMAAGDVVASPFGRDGLVTFDHVGFARHSGDVAAKNMLIDFHNWHKNEKDLGKIVPLVPLNHTPKYYTVLFGASEDPLRLVGYGQYVDSAGYLKGKELIVTADSGAILVSYIDSTKRVVSILAMHYSDELDKEIEAVVRARRKVERVDGESLKALFKHL